MSKPREISMSSQVFTKAMDERNVHLDIWHKTRADYVLKHFAKIAEQLERDNSFFAKNIYAEKDSGTVILRSGQSATFKKGDKNFFECEFQVHVQPLGNGMISIDLFLPRVYEGEELRENLVVIKAEEITEEILDSIVMNSLKRSIEKSYLEVGYYIY